MPYYMGFEYDYFDSKITINKYTGSATSINIPAQIEGLPVTSIHDSAFKNRSSLKSITIPNSITSIGNSAFSKCTDLTSINIPDSVTFIGNRAFRGCTSLTSITIPEGVTSIGDWAFSDCTNLTSITIPDSVTSIGNRAFWGCTSLTEITLPEGVTSIGDWAFSYCTSLTSITIPEGVTSIGDWAFSDCTNLTSITIPNSVTYIGYKAFSNCNSLKNVEIYNSAVHIANDVFDDHTSIIYIRFPKSLMESAFFKKTVKNFRDDNSKIHYYNSLNNFFDKINRLKNATNLSDNNLTGVKQIETIVLSDRCTTETFNSADSILDDFITIQELQRKIETNPVINLITLLEGISERKIENAPKYINKLNNEIAEIEARIKTSIEALTPPKVVKKKRVPKVKSNPDNVTVPVSTNSVKKKRFKFCPECGTGNVSNRKKCKGCGHDISDVISFEYDVEDFFHVENFLYGEDFEYKSDGFEVKITKYKGPWDSVNIPSRIDGLPVTSIGEEAFVGCESLKSINIPKGVNSIGSWAFNACISLTSIEIPNSVTSIGVGTFSWCTGLKSIKIPDSVTDIGEEVFAECDSLTTIHFPNSLRNVKGDNNTLERFRNEYRDKIRYYKTDTKTARVMKVPDFWRNNFAESQTEPKGNFKYSNTEAGIHIDKYIGHNAIVSIPEAIENLPVKSIGYRAFDNENLYKVIIPASVNTIVYSAFVSQQPIHVLFKGDSIQIIPQSFIAPQITFYYTNNAIAGILYGIADNNPKYIVNYNATDFDKV